ncbi:glycosyltransferase family 21 protein [Trichoderma longibrachiatum ATCC 18648]|uniref:Glycosyltransferase family 21 protein n=1 Tax=Trichoderma longibrachiatum ATCC 18648 TaxID=983965 RepID=A0A2T4CB25_TRILO|nr:glycosyltransferase family 21 protein [Trichoderma longibrachiatum ATCC 18648]
MTSFVELLAAVCLVWAVVVVLVQTVGITAIFIKFKERNPPPVSSTLEDAPSVTIIRPVKGLEPCLYECIASTFRQDYRRQKSNMFRKAHLDQVTDPARNPLLPANEGRPRGVDYFSHNICEDHLIGDLLWRSKIPGYKNHGIAWGDLVLQPMAGMSVSAYAARRVRWLRARKFTVLAATLVEPGVESLLCCAYLAFGLTTLPGCARLLGIPQTWSAMGFVWLAAMFAWMMVDWHTFKHLHTGCTIETDQNTPRFAFGSASPLGMPRRRFVEWLPAWIAREALALPIWTRAVLLGTTVNWRGKVFHVRLDTTVEEVSSGTPARLARTPELERARQGGKDRLH